MWVQKLKTTQYKACERDTPQTPNLNKRKRDFYEKKRRIENKKTKRDIFLKIRVTEEELEAFQRKYKNSGMRTFSGFVRAMLLDGYIVHFNEDELHEIYRLATSISNNINQIIVQVSRNDNSFDSDFAEIKEKMAQIWQPLNFFTCKVLQLRH